MSKKNSQTGATPEIITGGDLKRLRTLAGITQPALARAADLSKSRISQFEKMGELGDSDSRRLLSALEKAKARASSGGERNLPVHDIFADVAEHENGTKTVILTASTILEAIDDGLADQFDDIIKGQPLSQWYYLFPGAGWSAGSLNPQYVVKQTKASLKRRKPQDSAYCEAIDKRVHIKEISNRFEYFHPVCKTVVFIGPAEKSGDGSSYSQAFLEVPKNGNPMEAEFVDLSDQQKLELISWIDEASDDPEIVNPLTVE